MSSEKLTIPDLVLLSLLAERPLHGYQANALLELRQVRDWAGVSRPQVYYSLDKLARLRLIRAARGEGASAGPERQVFETTPRGRAALQDALELDHWTRGQERPAFLTWLALSWQCRDGVFLDQLRKRQEFLDSELKRKEEILASVREEVGHPFHEAVWALTLTLAQIRTEIEWVEQVIREAPSRGAAQNPEYPGAKS